MTPGHTDGSATFMYENMLFTGDTLFLESVGRTGFKTGNREQLVASVKKLYALTGDYVVYPGHDDFTTLEHERKYNTFVDYD
jgi:glyoxylase-like metal-dependent hydrolase (beta-lactamase superfamily II)